MSPAALIRALHDGRRVLGTLIVSPSPHWVPVVTGLGLDYVFIDTEHVPLDRESLSWMCRAYAAAGLPPLVRIPAPDPYAACMVLDGGAAGVIAPYVESPAQVRALAGAMKHKPLKGGRLEQALAGRPVAPALHSYLNQRNVGNALIVNIESVPALENLDEILGVAGLDAVLVGPHDLTCSLGIPEQWDHPDFIAAVDAIITKARARGIGAGIHIIHEHGLDAELRWAKLGANLILHHADLLAFRFAMARDLARLRAELGATATTESTTI
jgi:4-hydroxy-2-oxoheptanedioate aldolase